MKIKMRVTSFCVMVWFALFMLFTLAGCQLARENMEAETETYGDKLVGVYITTEYVDLFDREQYATDLLNSMNGITGEDVFTDADIKRYEERLYATMVNTSLVNEETGQTSVIEEYMFEGLTGVSYFVYDMLVTNGEVCTSSSSNPIISDGHVSINQGDNNKSVTLDGTIYVTPNGTGHTFYYNPVYQQADGGIYLVSGSGITLSGGMTGEGSRFSQTLEDDHTVTVNGESETRQTKVTVAVAVMFPPERIDILQMDADGTRLARTTYAPDAMPNTFEPAPGVAYVIVETHKRDEDGIISVARELYDNKVESFSTFFARSDGFCVKNWTQIIWPE